MTILEPRQVLPEDLLDGWFDVGEITTATGRVVQPWNLRPYDLHLDDIGPALSRTCRYAGQLPVFNGVPTYYSVAEHCCWVYNEMVNDGIEDMTLLRAGFLHDASEAYLLDVPSPVKKLPAMSGYRAAEDRAIKAVGERYGFDLFDPKTAEIVGRYDKDAFIFESRFVRTGILAGLLPQDALHEWRYVAGNLALCDD